ncbi:MAG: hypothetical protein ACRDYB_06730 [Acidimicrobiales bacterium]
MTLTETEGAAGPSASTPTRSARWSFLTRMDLWVLAVFGIWLVLVLVGLFVALHVLEPRLSLHDGFRTVVVNSDAGWLREINVLGYQWNGNANVASDIAFLPVYPLVVAAVHALGLGWNGACFLVSVVCQGVTLLLLGRLLTTTGATARQIRWAIGFALVYPAALFAVTGFGTTMLNLCVVGALLLHRRGHRTGAFVVAGLATGLYYTGLAVPVALVVAELRARGTRSVVSLPGVGRVLLGFSGVIGYMAYLWARFDNPFASLAVQKAWTGTASFGTVLTHAVTLSPVAQGFLGYISQRQEADLSHLFDAPFLLLLVIAAVWLLLGRHGIETWLLAAGGLLVLYNSAKAGYPFSVIRLAYPLFIVLPMNPRVRGLMDRVTWTVPSLGCLAISCYWITILARRLFTD